MTNKIFMAFATGSESTEGNVVKKYTGVGSVSVLAVNPDKETLEKLYNTTINDGPSYLSEVKVGPEGDKHTVPQVRIDFIVQTDPEKCNGIDMKTKIPFFITREVRYNRDRSKVQVINKYGETTWLPIENAKSGTIPSNLNWFEPADFRPAYIGEEDLTGFLKAYLNIPNKSYRKASGEVVEIPNKADAEARLDKIDNYFKGDYSELREAISLQPKNRVKGLFGVRTTEDGKQYQAVYTQKFLKNSVTDYSRLDAELQERKAAGAYPTTEFTVGDLKEYDVESTDLSNSGAAGDMPFPAAGNDAGGTPWDFGK